MAANGSYMDASTVNYLITKIKGELKKVYKIKGTVEFANLGTSAALTATNEGNVYNVVKTNASTAALEDWTTTADFLEGAGKVYPSGTNVVVVEATPAEGATPATYKYDVGVGFVDTSGFVEKAGDIMTGQLTTPNLIVGSNSGTLGSNAASVGEGNLAANANQFAIGHYNSNGNDTIFEVGNGTSSVRSNAFSVKENGDATAANDIIDGEGNKLSEVGNIPAYIVSGATEFGSGWLSKSSTAGATALTPVANRTYMVLTAGEYYNKIYRWDATTMTYVPIAGSTDDTVEEDMISGEFDPTASYAVDDLVLYNHKLYRCIVAHTGAWDASHFTQTSLTNEIPKISQISNQTIDDMWNGTYTP